jgi:hypothetical protein
VIHDNYKVKVKNVPLLYSTLKIMKKIIPVLLIFCFTESYAQVEYKDVAGIFFSRCTSCHHPDGAGPFPFMNYTQTSAEGTAIYSALMDGIMPPWNPDTTYTRFLHERIITSGEKNAILTWILNGMPAGDTTLAPPAPTYSLYQLQGTPTMELQIPTFVSNATTTDSYVCFSLPTNLTQDRVLRAFEVVPGNPSIVHHVIINVDTVGNTTNDLSGLCNTPPGDFGLGGFAPGAPPTVLPGVAPLKLGMPIKAGSKLVLQLHYPAGSAGMVDSTKIRLYFYPPGEPGIRPVRSDVPLQNWAMAIPPNQISTFTASFPPQPFALSAFATFPHSHLLCKTIINYAFSGTDTVKLVRVNDWDFEWQGYYTYRYPVKIPAGYQLFSSHTFDNTSSNPHNPNNPPQWVFAGVNTTDEMLFDAFQWSIYLPGDEFIDVGALLSNDTLLSGIQNPPVVHGGLNHLAFPNPSNDQFTIRYFSSDEPNPRVRILDALGRTVEILQPESHQFGSYFFQWDAATVPSGIYHYSIENERGLTGGKLIRIPR